MIIGNVNIVLEDTIIYNGSVEISDGLIVGVREESTSYDIDGQKNYLMAGFVDIHTHGGYGHHFLDCKHWDDILDGMLSEGITTVCPTSFTTEISKLNKFIAYGNSFRSKNVKIAGLNLEGPFISKSKRGIHQLENIVEIDHALLNLDKSNVKIVGYDIDKTYASEFTDYLLGKNIIPCIAHSNATCEKVLNTQGVKLIAHLFNGMSGVDHRNGGVALAGLISNMYTEVICDTVHVDKNCLKLIYKAKKEIIIITDALCCKGKGEEFSMYGKTLTVDNNVAYDNDTLAGSCMTMNNALKNFMAATSCSYSELTRFATINACDLLGIKDRGVIKKGYKADLVILNEDFEVVMTFVDGKIVYKNQVITKA